METKDGFRRGDPESIAAHAGGPACLSGIGEGLFPDFL